MTESGTLELDHSPLTFEDLRSLYRRDYMDVSISEGLREDIRSSRQVVEQAIEDGEPVYGVNTGFGKLASEQVPEDQMEELQKNLIRSHAIGLGESMDRRICRLVHFLVLHEFTLGYSGVTEDLVEQLLSMFNARIIPVIPEVGSVGASGDLAPLAHLGRSVMGEGEVFLPGSDQSHAEIWERNQSAYALRREGLESYSYRAKEGLSIVNGTEVSLAQLLSALLDADRLLVLADIAGAMSLDALKGSTTPFRPEVAQSRAHPGQGVVTRRFRALMEESEIRESHLDCDRIQDQYSLRCIPQVHGSAIEGFRKSKEMAVREVNSTTDNPLVLEDSEEIISAGNFHGQPLSLASDLLSIALSDLASISERRIENLTNPDLSGLPPFLTEASGLNSGLMLGQVVAASLVSENKTLSHPASVDSLPTSANQEDHVSMSTFAGRKVNDIVTNLERVLAIELICAAQGIEFHEDLDTSPPLEKAHEQIRDHVPFLEEDRSMRSDVEEMISLVRSEEFYREIEAELPNGMTFESFKT